MNALLGEPNDVSVDPNEGFHDYYEPNSDGSIRLVFSTAAFRLVLTIYITVLVTRGRHFGARESV
jgi:hypothetical protein